MSEEERIAFFEEQMVTGTYWQACPDSVPELVLREHTPVDGGAIVELVCVGKERKYDRHRIKLLIERNPDCKLFKLTPIEPPKGE